VRVLVTGIAGFIGSHLADRLRADGHDVSGIDNLSTGRAENAPFGLLRGDIREFVPKDHWDLIYHCAASYADRADWERDASTNVGGTIRVVREAKRSGARLVYFQTALCYGPRPQSPVQTDAPLAPVGSYAVSKTAGEAYIRDSGVEWVSLRLANVYGPRNLSGPIPTFAKQIMSGEPCTVVDSRRDFVYVDDLVRVAMRAGLRGGASTTSRPGTIRRSSTCTGPWRGDGHDGPEPVVQPADPMTWRRSSSTRRSSTCTGPWPRTRRSSPASTRRSAGTASTRRPPPIRISP
jgi:UDP-glucose 4-epimerase